MQMISREPNLGSILSCVVEFVIIQLSAFVLEYVHGQIESFHLCGTNSEVTYLTFDVSDICAFQYQYKREMIYFMKADIWKSRVLEGT